MLNNKALHLHNRLELFAEADLAYWICMSFRLLSNQQSTTVFGIIRRGNKRMEIIVL